MYNGQPLSRFSKLPNEELQKIFHGLKFYSKNIGAKNKTRKSRNKTKSTSVNTSQISLPEPVINLLGNKDFLSIDRKYRHDIDGILRRVPTNKYPKEIKNLNLREYQPNRVSGVYFLLIKDVVVYIGQSVDVKGRILYHATSSWLQFEKAVYVECPKEHLISIEATFVTALTPLFNRKIKNYRKHVIDIKDAYKILGATVIEDCDVSTETTRHGEFIHEKRSS